MAKNFKGSLTATQIVTIVILVVSFILVIDVLFNVLDEGLADREICHTSVVSRMTLPDTMIINLKELPKLNCKTKNICITDEFMGEGDCEDDFKTEEYWTMRITKDPDEKEKDINRLIARELVDCWNMMGKGEDQIFTRSFSTSKACSICSRIAFDEDLKKELKNIKGLADYLKSYNVPNHNETYLTYLTKKRTIEGYDRNKDSFTTDQKAIVFLEVDSSLWEEWVTEVIQSQGGGIIGAKTGAMIGAMIPLPGTAPALGILGYIGGTATGWFIDSDTNKKDREYRTGWDFIDYSTRNLNELKCTSFENLA
ncbi:MAG: hypothetical protein ABIB47_02215 [Candidatus Woesearchaeota archaeon]